jgi:hypothetical protein
VQKEDKEEQEKGADEEEEKEKKEKAEKKHDHEKAEKKTDHEKAEKKEHEKAEKKEHEKAEHAPIKPKDLSCNPFSDDTDYWTKSMLFTIPNIATKEMCNQKCFDVAECGAWTWGKARDTPGLSNVCFIKVVDADGSVTFHGKRGVVSGKRSSKDLCAGEESEEYFEAKAAWEKYQASHEDAGDSKEKESSKEEDEDKAEDEDETKSDKHDKKNKSEKKESHSKESHSEESHSEEFDSEEDEKRDHVEKKPLKTDHAAAHLKSRHGNCLQAGDEAVEGAEVQMMTCAEDDKAQHWAYEAVKGHFINQKHGLCLTAGDRSREYVHITVEECSDDWNQQWDYLQGPGTLKNWRGICLDGAEAFIDGGEVYMRACNQDVDYQHFLYGSLDEMPEDEEATQAGTSLFCFALMLPGSYEQDLLAMQYNAKVSLFQCEGFAVLSNKSIVIAPGLTSGVADSDLQCKKGGEFGTALNLDIFIAVWEKVIADGVYLKHDWTVKVDPDAVFFADRLRSIVGVHSETPTGVYLNNCKYGLHGPIEVFSKNAVTSWATGRQQCQDYFWKLCHGDCFWGEDLFIDQCLWKVLKIRRDNDWRLLTEDHCSPPKDWDSCEDASRVSFHPFKKADAYMKCVKTANQDSLN